MTTTEVETGRDLSRAHWQRSVGAVIFREAGDRLFAAPALPDDEVAPLIKQAGRKTEFLGDEAVWTIAQSVLFHTLRRHSSAGQLTPEDSAIRDSLERHTYYRTFSRVVAEATAAQVYYPLNLANLVSYQAGQQAVSGYSGQSFADVARILRRPDFRQLIDQSALTRNGVLRHLSGADCPPEVMADKPPFLHFERSGILFDSADNVHFHSGIRKFFLERLRENNVSGLDEGYQVDVRSSSGCPARHKSPHFDSSTEDGRLLATLSRGFGKSEADLTSQRPQSVIDDGLDWMAVMLDDLDSRT